MKSLHNYYTHRRSPITQNCPSSNTHVSKADCPWWAEAVYCFVCHGLLWYYSCCYFYCYAGFGSGARRCCCGFRRRPRATRERLWDESQPNQSSSLWESCDFFRANSSYQWVLPSFTEILLLCAQSNLRPRQILWIRSVLRLEISMEEHHKEMKKVRSCRTNGNASDTSYGSSERGVSCFSCILWSLESDCMGYEPKIGCETHHRTNEIIFFSS